MRVLNARHVGTTTTADNVYVGRPSKWGNPFKIGRDGNREEVIQKYMDWFCGQPDLIAQLHELRGKNLVCWCSPEPCHADFLIEAVQEIYGADEPPQGIKFDPLFGINPDYCGNGTDRDRFGRRVVTIEEYKALLDKKTEC